MSAVERQDYHAGGDHSFNENSPRPPVPGEETEVFGGSQSPAPGVGYSSWGTALKYNKGGSSPVLTPRRSSLAYSSSGLAEAPLGFEPEGRCGSGDGSGSSFLEVSSGSPPSYLRWARHLHSLLEDPDGVELFRRYLDQEGRPHADTLNFWFACEGLKKQHDPDKINQLVKVIHRRFIQKAQLAIPEDLRKDVNRTIKEGKDLLGKDVFDGVQAEVERLINETTYPNFLKSEMYLGHVQAMQNGGELSSSGGSSGSSSGGRGTGTTGGLLPTLHEDSELVTGAPVPVPLTRDMLIATQKRRAVELRPKPEAYAGDGMSVGRGRVSRKQHMRHSKQMKESASMNRDPYMHHTLIPRTQRIQKEQVHPMKPDQFAAILIDKLEGVQREQEAQEKLDRKLQEGELLGGVEDRTLADAIRERLLVDDDSDQAILDQHVSRVWSDLTPSRSPGLVSPRPKSPEGRRRAAAAAGLPLTKLPVGSSIPPLASPSAAIPSHFSGIGLIHSVPHPYQSHTRPSYFPRHARKEKDMFSTFSSDSGNVHDFPEGTEHKHHGHMPKSKSMPDYQEAQKQDMYSSMTGHDARFRQSGRDACRRSSSKKTLTDLTDSGVSVVSDSTPVNHPGPQCKDRVLTWLLESEKQGSNVPHSHSDRELSSKHRLRGNTAAATSPIVSRHSRKPGTTFSSSRSGSLERGTSGPGLATGVWSGPSPAQPFVADPSMPPLPLPHTATQLEEARRRLIEEEGRAKLGRQRFNPSSKLTGMHTSVDAPLSGQSTLRRSGRGVRSSQPGIESSEFTTVVFSFCEEQFPYRTKIPGHPVTLKQFKEYLPKKGSYRYFFKTECDDLDMKVIQEEIMDDNEVLPLWDGKVMAQVKPIE